MDFLRSEWFASAYRKMRFEIYGTVSHWERPEHFSSAAHRNWVVQVFSATCSTETLVATSVSNYVHVHRLKENRLELREKIRLNDPYYLLYVLDRLLATEWDNGTDSVTEVSLRLERHRQLISPSERIRVLSWCALNDGIAIFDSTSRDMLLYSRIILDPIADYNRRERKSAAPTERRLSEAGQIWFYPNPTEFQGLEKIIKISTLPRGVIESRI